MLEPRAGARTCTHGADSHGVSHARLGGIHRCAEIASFPSTSRGDDGTRRSPCLSGACLRAGRSRSTGQRRIRGMQLLPAIQHMQAHSPFTRERIF